MGNSITFQQSDIFSRVYLAECPGCGQEFDILPRQGAYRGGRRKKYCSDRCRKTATRRDARLQAAITAGAIESHGEAAQPAQNQQEQAPKKPIEDTAQRGELPALKTSTPASHHLQQAWWWYLIESGPAALGQIGPLVEEQAHRLLQRLTTEQTRPALYHAPSLAVALDLHQRRQQSPGREIRGVNI